MRQLQARVVSCTSARTQETAPCRKLQALAHSKLRLCYKQGLWQRQHVWIYNNLLRLMYLKTREFVLPNPKTKDSVISMPSSLIKGTNCFNRTPTDGVPMAWNKLIKREKEVTWEQMLPFVKWWLHYNSFKVWITSQGTATISGKIQQPIHLI